MLLEEIKLIPKDNNGIRCKTGCAIITKGYNLKAKNIIHTVGPYYDIQNNPQPKLLASCYTSVLNKASSVKLRSVAFPCIATGYYGFPMVWACRIALRTVREWLCDHNESTIETVYFIIYNDLEQKIYNLLFPIYYINK